MNNNLIKRFVSSITIIPLAFFFILKGGYYFNFFLITCLILSLFEWNNMKINYLKKNIGFIFILFSFYSAYKLKILELNEETIFNFSTIIIICIFTDMGGYIFGKILKGPKITKISPNKTYAGVLGGFLCSIIFLYSTIYLGKYIININLIFNLENILWILFISLISQIGDLIISYFKRQSNIKDTGNLIPGHGGILDRIDGMVFVFPVIFILNQYL